MSWIGVDLDGTLAYYEKGYAKKGLIGDPVPLMAERVREWLKQGKVVKILTARMAWHGKEIPNFQTGEREIIDAATPIQDWTEKHFGVRLPVTNAKDPGMIELWDDRAIRVEMNTGRII